MTFDEWVISRLIAHGLYQGRGDGAPGRAMSRGIEAFQKLNGLPVTGLANEQTVESLRLAPRHQSVDFGGLVMGIRAKPVDIPAEPVWMREARRYMGLREIAGPKSNPTILGWAARLGGWVASFYKDDDTPWCGLAVGAWISVTLPREVLPSNPLGALNWSTFGKSLKAPSVGAILTFRRPGGGHVGLYVGEDATHYHVLGGNQSNSVSITRIDKERLAAIRWPRTGGDPVGGRVALTASGEVSRNEA